MTFSGNTLHRPRPLWAALCCCALWFGSAQAQQQDTAPRPDAPPAAAPAEKGSGAEPSEERRSAQEKHAEAMYAQYGARVAQAMAASRQPRALALAAMLAVEHPALRPHAAAWWQAALEHAGRDNMVYRMALMFLKPQGPQDETVNRLHEIAARRWLALDAGNLAPLLYMEQSAAQLLTRAAAVSHNDDHLFETLRWIYASLRQYPPTAREAEVLQLPWDEGAFPAMQWNDTAMLTGIALSAAARLPRHERLRNACREEALRAEPARRSACHRAAWVLARRSTSTVAAMLGLRLQMELSTSAHECQIVQAQGTRLRWLLYQWGQWLRQPGHDRLMDYARRTLTDPGIGSEQQAIQTLLREHGMDLEPPPEWSGARANDPC